MMKLYRFVTTGGRHAQYGRRPRTDQGPRRGVETDLRHLKQTMKMDILHCNTADGVEKELAVFVPAYNLARRVMEEA